MKLCDIYLPLFSFIFDRSITQSRLITKTGQESLSKNPFTKFYWYRINFLLNAWFKFCVLSWPCNISIYNNTFVTCLYWTKLTQITRETHNDRVDNKLMATKWTWAVPDSTVLNTFIKNIVSLHSYLWSVLV